MNRIWFGAALLAALLVLGIGSAALMEDAHLSQAAQLNRAADLALSGNWKGARSAFEDARTSWDQQSSILAGLASHEPMDQIEGCFAQLEVFAQAQDTISFCSSCGYLARQLEALGKSHSFNLQNLF